MGCLEIRYHFITSKNYITIISYETDLVKGGKFGGPVGILAFLVTNIEFVLILHRRNYNK